MSIVKTKVGRRAFLKTSVAAGGGLMISFSWLASCTPGQTKEEVLAMPKEWFELNAYLKIGENGRITINVPNPEFGQNIKTSMPMIVAEELDVEWKQVIAEQADFDKSRFDRQFTGGSQGIRRAWNNLRMAGATGRRMLLDAAAEEWNVPLEEITTNKGVLVHTGSGKSASYGQFAAAAARRETPTQVPLKSVSNFDIIGTSKKNLDGKD
ncbi:MAG: molybdopterin cofactor-binding domain-containing protein, partial [Cyclobacteriaceae bacterium]